MINNSTISNTVFQNASDSIMNLMLIILPITLVLVLLLFFVSMFSGGSSWSDFFKRDYSKLFKQIRIWLQRNIRW
jgi:hypothetical protein